MKNDVIVSGLNVVDLLFTLPEKIQKDSKHEVEEILLQGGAPAGNAASVMATLGLKTAFLGYEGKTSLSVVAKTELERCGVDTSLMVDKPEHAPAIALVEIDAATGERTVFYSLKDYRQLAAEDINPEWIKESRLVFVDGYDIDTNLELLKLAKEFNVPSVLDIEAGDREKLEAMLALGSHCILPLECAQFLANETDEEACLIKLSKMTDGQLVITDGARGSWALEDGKVIHQTVFPTDVVDTTGCGDSYHGAYAYALLTGKSLQERMTFASAYASIIARYVGGRTYHPTVEEVEAIINSKK